MTEDSNHHLLRASTAGSVLSSDKVDPHAPVTKQSLVQLMKKRKTQGAAELRSQYGTADNLVAALKSNVKTGLCESDEVGGVGRWEG